MAALALVTLAGLVAALALARRQPRAAFCLVAILGFVLLWLIGALLPFLTRSPILLNLHLLRAGAGIYLFTALAVAALTTVWARGPSLVKRRLWAPLLALASATSHAVFAFTIPVVALAESGRIARRPPRRIARPRLDWGVAIALVLILWPAQIILQARFSAPLRGNVATWRALGRWANAHTPPDAVFLLPTLNFYRSSVPAADPTQAALAPGSGVFETFARRRVWIDDKSGAAVMWSPSFYHLWHDRLAEVVALPDHAARMEYARLHGIRFVIDECGSGHLALAEQNKRCIYAADGAH